jgi:asparagine synthase (glutamine-hydrolysing)
MLTPLSHRGPDGHGVYLQDNVGLGHVRLSIIDLEGGAQPMSNAEGDLWITFNGEIFNYIELREELIKKGHSFRTRSDTEVILHLYQEEGEDFVARLNGQWAFAIWDSRRKKLFLSRDRFGVRPLFYAQMPDTFLFASEIKAILTSPEVDCDLDPVALDQIFTFWVTLPPRTAFKNINQLPPGHSLTLQGGQTRVWQHWTLEYAPEYEQGSVREELLAEELVHLLTDATRIRLRSDVPVGAYLSGGLDSTVIAALTKGLVGDRLRTFSIAFENPEFDESSYQQEASQFLHTSHTCITCSHQDIANVFSDVVWHAEQPILRTAPAPMYLLAKSVHHNNFKVVLTGEGADEILGGYDIFKEAKIRRFWGNNPSSSWRPQLLKRLYPYMADVQRQPLPYLKHFFSVNESDLVDPLFSHLPRWGLTSKLKALVNDDIRVAAERGAIEQLRDLLPAGFASWHPFNRAEYLEALYLLPGYILSSQGDRMAMAHSVEGRYPFLDYRVVEFAAKLPPSVKMKVLNQKYLLKRATAKLIPQSIQERHKQPYRAPDSQSLLSAKNADTYIESLVTSESIKRFGIFDTVAVDALLRKVRSGRAVSTKDNMALVGVISTQILIDRFKANGSNQPDTYCATSPAALGNKTAAQLSI